MSGNDGDGKEWRGWVGIVRMDGDYAGMDWKEEYTVEMVGMGGNGLKLKTVREWAG